MLCSGLMQLFLYLNYTVITKPQYKFSFDLMCWMISTIMANSTNHAEAKHGLNYTKQVLIWISQVKINFGFSLDSEPETEFQSRVCLFSQFIVLE